MQFHSYIFILLFFPVFITGYFVANKKNMTFGKVYLIFGSIIFYLYGGWNITIILGLSVLVNYLLAIIVNKIDKGRKVILFLTVTVNIVILLYYKYFNLLLSSINSVLKSESTSKEILLPLGISFFTFQQIMYFVNIYKKDIKEVDLLDYLVYVLYFPKLLMGPLVEPKDLILQINDCKRKAINWDCISYGIKLFSFGLFKKIILADTFAIAVSWGYENIKSMTSMDCFLVMLFYTFEIYFDFSGYSDMAVGISEMLNIKLPMNFNSPYKALSISDFWKRWHMSLTGFFTRYIYIPLGGNKKGKIRTYVNILIVFLVSGIWHGGGERGTFLMWGILHGILSIFDKLFEKQENRLIETVRWMGTFLGVNLLWLLFRSDSVVQWKELLFKMFTFQDMSVSNGLLESFDLPETSLIFRILNLETLYFTVRGLSLVIFTVVSFGLCLIPENNYNKMEKNNWVTMLLASVAFVWSFLCLSSESIFVYNNF